MYDKNKCSFSGEVNHWRRIQTKTGTPMTTFSLKCYKTIVKMIAFGDQAIDLEDGQRVEITGRLQNNNWTDKDGNKHYGYQVVVDSIQLDRVSGEEKGFSGEKKDFPGRESDFSGEEPPLPDDRMIPAGADVPF